MLTMHRNYDPHGPCGPMAYWKISDRHPVKENYRLDLADFLPEGFRHHLRTGQDPESDFEDEFEDDEDGASGESDEQGALEMFLPDNLEFIEIGGVQYHPPPASGS